jgi:hypothetical protein
MNQTLLRFSNMRVRAMMAGPALAAAVLLLGATPVEAQPGAPRVWVSGWAGRFTSLGGFSDGDLDAFFRFDDATAFGAGAHFTVSPGLVLGLDALYGTSSYQRFNRDDASAQGEGDAKVGSALASLRMAGGGGILGLYLSAGGGVFAWDLDDAELEEGWDLDLALQIAAGLEYAFHTRARLFAEYGQWWVYHQKDDEIQSNTPNHNLIRVGARLGF